MKKSKEHQQYLNGLIIQYYEHLRALNNIKSKIILFGGSIPKEGLPVELSSDYSRYWSLKDKIMYILEKHKKAFVSEIVDYIKIYDFQDVGSQLQSEDQSPEKLKATVAQYCSNFYREGLIDAEKVGKKNLYKFKEKSR